MLIREAGGLITQVDGSPYDHFSANSLATNGLLHPVLLEHFRQGGH